MIVDINSLNNHELHSTAKRVIKERFEDLGARVVERGSTLIAVTSRDQQIEVLVKSIRRPTEYVLILKRHMDVNHENLFVSLAIFSGTDTPELFLIPASAFQYPNDLLRDRPHYKDPEYGMNVSNKNMPLLNQYKLETQALNLMSI